MEIFSWVKASINLLLVQIISNVPCPKFVTLEQEANPSSTIESGDGLKIVLQRPWLNLPHDILELIANHLGAIDLLSFRGTCKEWRSCAPSEPSHRRHHDYYQEATTTNLEDQLWFLLYGKGEFPNCVFFDTCSKKINRSINIPELGKGVVCIASSGGWLLFFRYSNKSLFFFCPLSRVKIDLPKLPSYIVGESLCYINASFSSPPTSPDCVVCVFSFVSCIHRDGSGRYLKVVVNLLRRRANEWDHRLEYAWYQNYPRCQIGCVTLFDGDNIYIIDDMSTVSGFSLKERQWTYHLFDKRIEFIEQFQAEPKYFCLCKGLNKQKLGLKKSDSLSICGTVIQDRIKVVLKRCIFSEKYEAGVIEDWDGSATSFYRDSPIIWNDDGVPKGEEHKGVWFQPRFLQLPPNYTW